MAQTVNFNDLNQNQPKKPNEQKGSGYTNIQRIVQANQQNKLGQTIGGNIQQAGQNVRQNVSQGQQQFQQQAQANRLDTAQNQQLAQQAVQDPTQLAQNQQNVTQYQKLLSGVYQGPQGIQNAQQLQNQAQDVNQLAKSIGTQGGQQGLLQRFVGKPQYTAGQQRLDTLLLGRTGAQDLATARRANMGINQFTQSKLGAAEQQAQELSQRAREVGEQTRQQFGGLVGDINKQLEQKAQEAQQQRDAEIKTAREQIEKGEFSPELAEKFGISKDQLTYNIDPSKFLNEGTLKASAQNIAGQQDYAKLNALRQLSGQYGPQEASQILKQFEGKDTEAGKFAQEKAFNPDKAKYQEAIDKAKTDIEGRLSPTKQQLDPLLRTSNLRAGNQTAINESLKQMGFDEGQQQNILSALNEYEQAKQSAFKQQPGLFNYDQQFGEASQKAQSALSKLQVINPNLASELGLQTNFNASMGMPTYSGEASSNALNRLGSTLARMQYGMGDKSDYDVGQALDYWQKQADPTRQAILDEYGVDMFGGNKNKTFKVNS